jgi:hypothetical protein
MFMPLIIIHTFIFLGFFKTRTTQSTTHSLISLWLLVNTNYSLA